MYLSQVFMKQGRFLSLPKTSFLSFNGTTSYGELAAPWTSTDGNWTAEIAIDFTDAGLDNDILDTGVSTPLRIGGSGNFDFDNTMFSVTDNGSDVIKQTTPVPTDNKLHNIVLTGILQTTISSIAKRTTYFNGIIKSLTLTDLTTPANSRTYKLNSGSDLYELPDEASLGSELVADGGFQTGIGDWTAAYNATLSWTGSSLRVTAFGGTNPYARLMIPVEIGKAYLVTVSSVNQLASSIDLRLSSTNGLVDFDYLYHPGLSENSPLSTTVLATSDNLYIKVVEHSLAEGDYFDVTSISVRELPLALLYQNVSTSDWDNYYFDRCLGDNGGWVNKADSEDIIYNA